MEFTRAPVPTPEEIEERAKLIRDSWSDKRRRERRVVSLDPVPWTIPVVHDVTRGNHPDVIEFDLES